MHELSGKDKEEIIDLVKSLSKEDIETMKLISSLSNSEIKKIIMVNESIRNKKMAEAEYAKHTKFIILFQRFSTKLILPILFITIIGSFLSIFANEFLNNNIIPYIIILLAEMYIVFLLGKYILLNFRRK